MDWQYPGSSLPSGSYITSSDVVFKNTEDLRYNTLVEYIVDGDSFFSGTSKQFLVYDSGSNITSYKHPLQLDATNDYFYKLDGTLIDIDEVNYYTTTDTNIKVVEVDVEDTDTYILSDHHHLMKLYPTIFLVSLERYINVRHVRWKY